MFSLDSKQFRLELDPADSSMKIVCCGCIWEFKPDAHIMLSDGRALYLRGAECTSSRHDTGVSDAVESVYCFPDAPNLTLYTRVRVERLTGDLVCESRLVGDSKCEVSYVAFPSALMFGAKKGDGYTVLPRMQGTLYPAGEGIEIPAGRVMERDAYMPFFGQKRGDSGYCAIFETKYDAKYCFAADESVSPRFDTSLGIMRYRRVMRYTFFEKCDYNVIAKRYREYVKSRGLFVSLEEKIARNPNVAKLIGTPIVHEGIAVHIDPISHYYTPGEPDKNDSVVPFATRAAELRELKSRGVDRAYLHLDGWGKHGYDNLHPDPFPPNEAAGGADGMRALSDTCRELGYIFGIHDQYRDYYYDAPSFDFANAIVEADGSHPYCDIWYGGKHSYLCNTLAPDYVRRNYSEFEDLGIKIEGSYLDVFSVVGLDECFSPDHPCTREQSAAARREALEVLTDRGIIPSSEETIDCIVPSLALCHHSPYFTEDLGSSDAKASGIPIPLFNLVYHDAIIIPWIGVASHGGWGIPGRDRAFLHALLNGDTIYYSIYETAENIALGKVALELHKRVAKCELVRHEFLDDSMRRQRTTFSDGTTVEVDFENETWKISE